MAKKKVVTFLDNPPRRARRHVVRGGRTGRHHSLRKGASVARKKRHPPNGFKTWKAYMASIRPGAKKRQRRANPSTGGGSMKRKAKRSRRNVPAVAQANPPRKHYKRRRRNPPMFGALTRHAAGRGPVAFAMQTAGRAVVGVGGEVVVRKIRGSIFKQAPGTIMGSGIEALLGLIGGYALSFVHAGAGAAFAQGAVSAPLRTEIQQLGIPHVSDSLGDDGYVMGPGTGVTLISAFPEDYRGVVAGEEGDRSLGRYVSGASAGGDNMGGYVAGAINNAG